MFSASTSDTTLLFAPCTTKTFHIKAVLALPTVLTGTTRTFPTTPFPLDTCYNSHHSQLSSRNISSNRDFAQVKGKKYIHQLHLLVYPQCIYACCHSHSYNTCTVSYIPRVGCLDRHNLVIIYRNNLLDFLAGPVLLCSLQDSFPLKEINIHEYYIIANY